MVCLLYPYLVFCGWLENNVLLFLSLPCNGEIIFSVRNWDNYFFQS